MDSMIVIVLLGGVTLLIIGALVGHSLSQHLLASDLRRRAELGREIGEQWRQIQALRAQQGPTPRCPHCGRSHGPESAPRNQVLT